MINLKEQDNLIEFESEDSKIEKLKEWNIISSKAKNIKTLYYKGVYTDKAIECEVIGYLSKSTNPECIDKVYETAVILINGNTHKIAPAYLKQMQSIQFNKFHIENNE